MADFTPSHEIYDNNEIVSGDEMNFAFAGDIPLMISEHIFNKKEFTDRKNKEFYIQENKFENKSIIVQKMSNVENSITENINQNRCKKLRIYFK